MNDFDYIALYIDTGKRIGLFVIVVDFELVGRALLDRWGLEPDPWGLALENWTAPAPAPDIELDLFWAEFGEE